MAAAAALWALGVFQFASPAAATVTQTLWKNTAAAGKDSVRLPAAQLCQISQ